ncbi:WhiB family transcriptional regulator [Streptomyces mobaraensis]|uniref:Transcriptional regulator WhiB n=1 Tax=Streptomyces mobaraensis TaxID=35621 RepID=A0A5N5WDF6_STRMB|nr:WhiB family transcriptional regulator [Streptomyces mobaraensis]
MSPRRELHRTPSKGWRRDAACQGHDPELFFPIGTDAPAMRQTEQAKAVCFGCPVIDACRAWALDTHQDHGVWGGTSEAERRAYHRRRAARGVGQ